MNRQKAWAEQKGLELLRNTRTVSIPQIFDLIIKADAALLILEMIDSRPNRKADPMHFGIKLAQMHSNSGDKFGLDHDNFIGALIQRNAPCLNWSEFYLTRRLLPQFKIALDNKLLKHSDIPDDSSLLSIMDELMPDNLIPSLLHGDLWSGNYIPSTDSRYYLIDPAVFFGHSEIDIAMSMLFGGFDPRFYDGYFSVHPKQYLFSERIKLYQLYYLLVHLNLFGTAYYSPVREILNGYC